MKRNKKLLLLWVVSLLSFACQRWNFEVGKLKMRPNTCCLCCVWWEVVVPYTFSFLFHKVCFQCTVGFSSFAWISLIHLLLSQLLHISITYFFASLRNIPESSTLLLNSLLPPPNLNSNGIHISQ